MLNTELDIPEIRNHYHKNGYVRIHDILQPDIAKSLLDELLKINWEFCYLSSSGPVSITQDKLAHLTPQQSAQLNSDIMQKAHNGFSYFYYRSNLINSYSRVINDFYKKLSSDEVMKVFIDITGEDNINNINGQLTCYKQACFLRKHSDETSKENRAAAYVLNMTPVWELDWGGLLHLMDNKMNIIDVLGPVYNSLTIFKVPKLHYVSQVANYANGARYTVTGWLLKPAL